MQYSKQGDFHEHLEGYIRSINFSVRKFIS